MDQKDNSEYNNIIKPIMKNREFKKLYTRRHHGITRMEHSLRVSYYAYKVSKKLKWDYQMVTQAGLLHDFYIDKDEDNRFKTVLNHPLEARKNSIKYFNINAKQENIIASHMFPLALHTLPKYRESILIGLIDKTVATYELARSFKGLVKFKAQEIPIMIALIISKITF